MVINTGLNKKKESVSVELEESPKTAKKIRPKRLGTTFVFFLGSHSLHLHVFHPSVILRCSECRILLQMGSSRAYNCLNQRNLCNCSCNGDYVGFKKGQGLIDGTYCSVCLSEFEEDESLRLLPKCSHAFHINCIDTWLLSHKNCPLCRAPILLSATASFFSSSRNI